MTRPTNDTFLRALLRQPTDYTPMWLMRQAGRYLPEYRELRGQAASFMNLCTNPELACEVTLQPLRRFPLDAAILFSDILTIPDAMGLGLYFSEGEGPRFEKVIGTASDVEQLKRPDPSTSLAYVMDAVALTRKFCRRGGCRAPKFGGECLCFIYRSIPDRVQLPCAGEIARHRASHGAKADESGFHPRILAAVSHARCSCKKMGRQSCDCRPQVLQGTTVNRKSVVGVGALAVADRIEAFAFFFLLDA